MIATHLSQILAFVAMEKPASQHPDDIRDEKLKLLRAVKPASSQYCVLGQYNGYRDDPTVSPGSNTPTFAQLALFIENDRWAGVPFFIKAGKGLNERKAEVRVQLHETPCFIFEGDAKVRINNPILFLINGKHILCAVPWSRIDFRKNISKLKMPKNCSSNCVLLIYGISVHLKFQLK